MYNIFLIMKCFYANEDKLHVFSLALWLEPFVSWLKIENKRALAFYSKSFKAK